jgi:thiamine biosynthesis lipoprotein
MVRWPYTARLAVIAVALCMTLPAWVTPLAAQEHELATEAKRYTFTQAHLGTIVRLVFYSADRAEAKQLAARCFERVVELDRVFSDYRDDSELMKLCKVAHKRATSVSHDMFTVLACAQQISEQSGGAFDVTLGSSSKAWRERKRGDVDAAMPVREKVDSRDIVLNKADQTVSFNKPLSLDLGGIAKGYIADELAETLEGAGFADFAVSVGGEMVCAGSPLSRKGWSIDLEGPGQKVVASMELSRTALSSSGDSYQFTEIEGKRSAHVLDPDTGKGKQDQLNITVIAPTAMQADAWATALRVMGVDEGYALAVKTNLIEAFFTPAAGASLKTQGFPSVSFQDANK